jgi:hypothetical protein
VNIQDNRLTLVKRVTLGISTNAAKIDPIFAALKSKEVPYNWSEQSSASDSQGAANNSREKHELQHSEPWPLLGLLKPRLLGFSCASKIMNERPILKPSGRPQRMLPVAKMIGNRQCRRLYTENHRPKPASDQLGYRGAGGRSCA